MKTIEEEIDECFVRPLTKIFDGGEAPEGWNIREKAKNTIALSMTRCG